MRPLQEFRTILFLIVLGLNLHLQVPRVGFAETSIEMIAIATKMKKRVLVVILLENETHKTDCQVILAITLYNMYLPRICQKRY